MEERETLCGKLYAGTGLYRLNSIQKRLSQIQMVEEVLIQLRVSPCWLARQCTATTKVLLRLWDSV